MGGGNFCRSPYMFAQVLSNKVMSIFCIYWSYQWNKEEFVFQQSGPLSIHLSATNKVKTEKPILCRTDSVQQTSFFYSPKVSTFSISYLATNPVFLCRTDSVWQTIFSYSIFCFWLHFLRPIINSFVALTQCDKQGSGFESIKSVKEFQNYCSSFLSLCSRKWQKMPKKKT